MCHVILQDHMIKEWSRYIKFLKVCYNPDKFSDHSLFENGGLILLICNVTSGDQNFKGLCVFMFVWLCFVCLHLAKFDSHRYCGSGDKFGVYIHFGVSLPHDPIKYMWLKAQATLSVWSPHGNSPPCQVL